MEDLKQRISLGEDSYTQFKVNITNSDKLAEELVAFSNAKGGLLIVGVDDKAEIVGLSSDDIRSLKRLFAESKKLYADEEIIKTSDISDLNSQLFYRFLRVDNKTVYNELKAGKLSFEHVLQNLELLRNGHLTIAGNLIFGLEPQRFCPSFYVDAVYFDGNDITTNQFISKATLKGTFEKLYEDSLSFITYKLRRRQIEKNFNSNGLLEIDEEVLSELIINALVHRDYYINSSIKIFMFHNRIEIISPGKLTNSLTIEKIKSGISIHRNPILNSICKTVLPYSGYGSGIKRVISINPDIEFINDIEKEEFKCIIPRFYNQYH